MSEENKELSFRNKPRKRKSIYAEAAKELAETRKPPIVKQIKKEGKFIGVRFNAEEYEALQKLKDYKEYSTDSLTIKETIRLAYEVENEIDKIAEKLRSERLRWNISLKRLE